MSLDYETLRPFLIWPHGVLGTVVLILGVVVLVLPKGTPRHAQLGRGFYWSMLGSVAVAVPLMVLRNNWFLLLLSVMSFYMLVSGRREIARHRAGDIPFSAFDRVFTSVTLVSCLSMVGLGVWRGINQGVGGFAAVLIGLGALGTNMAWEGWKRRDGPPRHRLAWMVDHLGMMIGCFIAAVTAFSAVNLSRIDWLPTAVVWLSPSVLLVPLIIRWSRSIEKKVASPKP